MKVLYITHYLGNYGANKALLQLILDLKKRNGYAIVLVPYEGPFCTILNSHKIKYIVKNFHNWRYNPDKDIFFLRYIKLAYYLMYDIYNIVSFSRMFRKEEISLIHTNSSMVPAGAIIAKFLGVPHIWHLREFGEGIDYQDRFYFGRKIAGLFINYFSHKIIAISHAIKDYYSLIIKGDKLSVVYDGLPVDVINMNIPIIKSAENKINICIVGRIGEGKNQIEVLKALKNIEKRFLDNIVLYVVGDGDHEYLSLLKCFVRDNQLDTYVRFLGYRDDIYLLLEKMHIGIVSSKSEGFGLITIEYMFHKVAIIGSNSGANVELIKSNENGLLYALGDSESLAKKIEYLISNQKHREEMVQRAFLYAKEDFRSTISSQKILSIYSNLLEK